ncbi:MAG: tetratricopeptide repeat protein [Rhodothermales bacterium]|nr:tetratricopeptide repeat protein [Rhodothermales bacterium]
MLKAFLVLRAPIRLAFSGHRIVPLLIVVAVSLIPGRLAAQDRVDCTDGLARGENLYNAGQVDEALTFLQTCLRQGAFPEEAQQRDVYLLIGRAYHATSLVEDAKQALRSLLAIIPNYQPDPGRLSPSFIRLFEEVKAESPPELVAEKPNKKGGKAKWLIIGGGAVAAGVVTFLLVRPSDANLVLPGPPALPVNR